MTGSSFFNWAIDLLEQIEGSQEKKLWRQHYSVYSSNPGQEDLFRDLRAFMSKAYENGLVISNYHEVLQKWQLEERSFMDAAPAWLETQPYLSMCTGLYRLALS